jgi:hypothetical protein
MPTALNPGKRPGTHFTGGWVGNKMNTVANSISSIWSSQIGHTEIFILDKDSSTGHKTVPHFPHRKINKAVLRFSS